MMTLEEAIRHCQEKSCGNSECALEHKQLAMWLMELQYYRNIWKDPTQKPKEGEIVTGCCKYWEYRKDGQMCPYHGLGMDDFFQNWDGSSGNL